MKHKLIVFTIVFYFFTIYTDAQDFANWNNSQLILNNGLVKRVISYGDSTIGICTTLLTFSDKDSNYLQEQNPEFSFDCNNIHITGSEAWKVIKIEIANDELQGNGAVITLKPSEGPKVTLKISWLLYPNLPIIRKKLEIINNGDEDMNIESVDIENLNNFDVDGLYYSMTDYGRYKHTGPVVGKWHDPAIIMHHIGQHRGLVLGNEAPGVTKRTTTFLDGRRFTIGLTHTNQEYPFRKWLKTGESWESPWSFICLYRNTDAPYDAIEGPVQDFVRRHMGISIVKLDHIPSLAYNHWSPFRATVDEPLLKKLADASADCGIEELTLDAGWYTLNGHEENLDWPFKCGDYLPDPVKFPNGLIPSYKYIKEKGMRRGLWISLAMASKYSKVYREHPEWFILDINGKAVCVHGISPTNVTACFTTDWYKYIKDIISEQVKTLDLNYVKLDLAIVASAYMYDRTWSGCYATNHTGHRDQHESFLEIYRRAWQLFDDLHALYPQLYIDCTYETMGASHLIDYDMCKHADGNWLSNIYERGPVGALQARQLAWLCTPAIPASACMIGNLQLDDPNYKLYIKSVAGVFPIVLGDIISLSLEQKSWIKKISQWMHALQTKHNYMLFRQDLTGFGEPHEGHWDGFQRINTETRSGGLVGVFRHGAKELERQVFVRYLDPAKTYVVKKEITNEKIAKMTGKDLAEKGFNVSIEKLYDGALFSVDQQ